MINNSLTLIGYAISEYELDNEKNPYSSLNFSLEVEFFGMKLDDERVIVVNVPYIYRKRIDETKQIVGKLLIVEGLLIPKQNKENGTTEYIPTAKDIYIVGDRNNTTDLFEKAEGENDEW